MESFNTKQSDIRQGSSKKPNVVYTRIKYKRIKTGRNVGKKYKKRKLWLLGLTAVAFLLLLWGVASEDHARYTPDYEKVNIENYLGKEELSQEDYIVLFRQTGLARSAVDALREQGREEELLVLQEKFFAEIPIKCRRNKIISKEERVDENSVTEDSVSISARRVVRNPQENYAEIPYVEEGDILITFNCHVLGWRNGHAAIVVDGENGLTLEASELGSDSAVMSMNHWKRYPSFAVLRLKGATKEERQQIAEYAMSEMVDVPYYLAAGWGDWAEGTHCSHLVWQAYDHFGYNLDSDGGIIVTPHDLYESPLLEFVQVYGMPIAQ